LIISLVENAIFQLQFPIPFQPQFLIENNKLSWKILFAIENHGSQQVQVVSNILVENVSHVSTPHQFPLQTLLVVNDIDYYN
jgi:alpha-D-ribose 1-methylphosphonate 5-phosphate C-P lyase